MTRSHTTLLLLLASLLALFYLFHRRDAFRGWSFPLLSEDVSSEAFNKWHDCMLRDMSLLATSSADVFWTELENPVRRCEEVTEMRELPMRQFTNLDETKYSILPVDGNTVSTIVTIGVGQDVNAEQQLQKHLGHYSVQFYGADPIVEGNDELYSKLGQFFPFAVGNSSRMATASVLLNGQYVEKRVVHVEFLQFLKEIIGKKFFDNIWVDGEYAEYELFEYFYTGGRLDEGGITVCQFNMEMHLPDLEQKRSFKRFIEQLFADRRYAFFRPVRGSHIRLFFVNFRDPNCVKKYISG